MNAIQPPPGRQAAADPLIGRIILGCRLEQRMGAGALGVVYAGTRTADGARVAVKMLTTVAAKDAENVKRQQREAELGRMISHPNIAAVHAGGCEGGIHALVMELVEGADMETVIDRNGRLPWRSAAKLMLQVGRALEHLDSVGIIHRDLKPGNILITVGGVAKLVDLGFAKSGEVHDVEALTVRGTAMGSPAYMPPEQIRDASSVGHAADVYGLGATFYHAITGREPFSARTVPEIMSQVLTRIPDPPRSVSSDIPPAVSALIDWCLAKEPGHRPASARDFVRELELAVASPDDVRRIARLRRLRDGTWVVAAVVVAALAGLAALVWWLGHR